MCCCLIKGVSFSGHKIQILLTTVFKFASFQLKLHIMATGGRCLFGFTQVVLSQNENESNL